MSFEKDKLEDSKADKTKGAKTVKKAKESNKKSEVVGVKSTAKSVRKKIIPKSSSSNEGSVKVVKGNNSNSKKLLKKKVSGSFVISSTGRRKCSVARCYLTEGDGYISVNDVNYVVYFKNNPLIYHTILIPLKLLNCEKKYNVSVSVNGGGFSSQADAIKLSISLCLSKISVENRSTLKSVGYLTTDARVVERKKPGRKKARKRFQFSKR